jgi:hypothetical protein
VNVNPLFIAYASDAHLYAEQYAGTTAVFVSGQRTENTLAPEWQRVRDRGSEVYEYRIHIERPNTRVSAFDELSFMGDLSKVPLWPYKTATGQQRSQFPNTMLTDIRVGSPWVRWAVDNIAALIRSKRCDGAFLDGFGGQLWGASGWTGWPLGERQEWQAGTVDFARLLDGMRRAENPNFILVGNNHWDSAPAAEKYVDGIVSENHPLTNAGMKRIVGKPSYSPLGQRRVFTISRTVADAKLWAAVPGVTHVACTEENSLAGRSRYSRPVKPVVGYKNLRLSTDTEEIKVLEARIAALMAEHNFALVELDGARDEVMVLSAAKSSVETKLQAARARLSQIAADAAVEV